MSYTADQLIEKLKQSKAKLRTEEIACDAIEKGFKFIIKELDGGLLDHWNRCFEAIITDRANEKRTGSAERLVIALSLVDQGGSRCFKPDDFKAHAVIDEMPSQIREMLADNCYRISKMRKKDKEDTAKNSGQTPESDSGST
jgi:hypothetical protein